MVLEQEVPPGAAQLWGHSTAVASGGARGPRPTLRWVFQLLIWVRLVVLAGKPQVLNLAPHHATVARLLGVERYYLLE